MYRTIFTKSQRFVTCDDIYAFKYSASNEIVLCMSRFVLPLIFLPGICRLPLLCLVLSAKARKEVKALPLRSRIELLL